jgi:type II secretory pathway pseudopilin PulG
MDGKRQAGGFTLIELLVIIAIIAILITLLSPVLRLAKERAQQTVCVANLKSIGVSSLSFANDHLTIFPRAWKNTWTISSVLPYINSRSDDAYNSVTGGWLTWGTSHRQYREYGISDSALLCPSGDQKVVWECAIGCDDRNWDNICAVGYMFISGTHPADLYVGGVSLPRSTSILNYGTKIPAVTLRDPGLANRVVVADTVFRGGGITRSTVPGQYWPDDSKINHRRISNYELPDIQNILWGDGRVTAKDWNSYVGDVDARLNCDNGDFSIRHWPNGGFWFFGH